MARAKRTKYITMDMKKLKKASNKLRGNRLVAWLKSLRSPYHAWYYGVIHNLVKHAEILFGEEKVTMEYFMEGFGPDEIEESLVAQMDMTTDPIYMAKLKGELAAVRDMWPIFLDSIIK
jgi:hypothetical protein